MALVPPRTVTLADGAVVTLRCAVHADAEALLAIMQTLILDNEGQLRAPGELPLTSVEGERVWIEGMRLGETDLLLIAEARDQVVGIIDFHGGRQLRLAHTGWFGMGLIQEWRGRGLGRHLLTAVIDWAEDHPLLRKVDLQCRGDNLRAMGLYRSLGFVEEGRQRDHIRLEDGTTIDNVLMARPVGRQRA